MIEKFIGELSNVLRRTPKAMLNLPGMRSVRGLTPTSALDLFDYSVAQKMQTPGWYWRGESLHISNRGTHGMVGPDNKLARNRKLGWGLAGGLLGSMAIGIDPMGIGGVSIQGGMHAAIGGTMYNLGGKTRMLGIGYLSLAGINAFRRGDNTGPM